MAESAKSGGGAGAAHVSLAQLQTKWRTWIGMRFQARSCVRAYVHIASGDANVAVPTPLWVLEAYTSNDVAASTTPDADAVDHMAWLEGWLCAWIAPGMGADAVAADAFSCAPLHLPSSCVTPIGGDDDAVADTCSSDVVDLSNTRLQTYVAHLYDVARHVARDRRHTACVPDSGDTRDVRLLKIYHRFGGDFLTVPDARRYPRAPRLRLRRVHLLQNQLVFYACWHGVETRAARRVCASGQPPNRCFNDICYIVSDTAALPDAHRRAFRAHLTEHLAPMPHARARALEGCRTLLCKSTLLRVCDADDDDDDVPASVASDGALLALFSEAQIERVRAVGHCVHAILPRLEPTWRRLLAHVHCACADLDAWVALALHPLVQQHFLQLFMQLFPASHSVATFVQPVFPIDRAPDLRFTSVEAEEEDEEDEEDDEDDDDDDDDDDDTKTTTASALDLYLPHLAPPMPLPPSRSSLGGDQEDQDDQDDDDAQVDTVIWSFATISLEEEEKCLTEMAADTSVEVTHAQAWASLSNEPSNNASAASSSTTSSQQPPFKIPKLT
jgi:hypothetical protein